jgi:mono/diheme cytochrome c family protein
MIGFVASRRGRFVMISGLVIVVVAVAAAWWWLRSPAIGADPGDPQQVALGRAAYAQHCASCHGDKLQGQPKWRERLPNGRLPAPPHDETGHTWHHADQQLFNFTKHGLNPYVPGNYENDMPAFADMMTDAEIWAALAFIKHAWRPEIQARQERINEQWRHRN